MAKRKKQNVEIIEFVTVSVTEEQAALYDKIIGDCVENGYIELSDDNLVNAANVLKQAGHVKLSSSEENTPRICATECGKAHFNNGGYVKQRQEVVRKRKIKRIVAVLLSLVLLAGLLIVLLGG